VPGKPVPDRVCHYQSSLIITCHHLS
jgi:hypothetical protein